MRRACVFVDGENFRHSLKHLFPSGRYTFGKGDYLPETENHNDQLEFRRSGSIPYELATKQFGVEKASTRSWQRT